MTDATAVKSKKKRRKFKKCKFEGKVIATKSLSPYIKEISFQVPDDVDVEYIPGCYFTIKVPEYRLPYKDIAIADEYKKVWDDAGEWDLVAFSEKNASKAYSIASYPAEGNGKILTFVIKICTPPDDQRDVPPGVVSSYIFGLNKGDSATIQGTFGQDFFVQDTDKEMMFIARGAGMAPIRSMVLDLLLEKKTDRKITLWFCERYGRDLFYVDQFKQLEKEHPNFTFFVALTRSLPEDNWTGPIGHMQNIIWDDYLVNHEDPKAIEYYMCGAPIMCDQVEAMLTDKGVSLDDIKFDKF
jgi:Na+-transporting NADH:ubiquinone oxidoreductase subunit F